jgi:type I restriction enzyme S subunit
MSDPKPSLYRPVFPQHWTRRPLYSFAEWVNGLAFRDVHFSPTGRPVIKIAEVKSGISGQTKFTQQIFRDAVRVTCGDLIFSWSGQPETSIDVFWWRGPEGWLNQHLFRVTPAPAVDNAFFYYLLRYIKPNFVGIARNKQTTGLGHVTRRDLEAIEAAFPALTEQRAIAEGLGTLDDKIENAERIGDLASDLAIAAGVSALEEAAGKPVYLSAQADLIKGVSYRSEDLVEGGGHLVGLKCVGRDGRFRREGLKPFSGDCRPEQLVRQGDVLVAQTDLTQKAEVIGRPIRFPKLDSGGRLVASLDLVIARPHAPLTRETLVALLSTQGFRDHAMSYCNGTTVLHMSSRALPDYRFIMPSPSIMEKVGNVMRTLFARADAARKESLVLAQLRDTLLPRLLSGELRVRDAEAAVEGAV